MGTGYKHGAGGASPLNFKVADGTTEPSNPKENLIWVNTDTPVTTWIFSPDRPETPTMGMVWFKTGLISNTPFNSFKKNVLQVFPTFTMQYVDGAWVAKTGKIYQSGWKTLWDGTLYQQGDLYESLTGGWVMCHNGTSGVGYISTDNIIFLQQGNGAHSTVYTKNLIDLTGFTRLTAELYVSNSPSNVDSWPNILISSQNTANYPAHSSVAIAGWTRGTTGTASLELNISAYQGKYYVGAWASACNAQIIKIQLQ